ncbi:MAG TPA: thioredoxin domain-containing protein [Allosphingosinicella sp.]|jgi:protein-disulfide isomerase|uniref:DsbA family protein n=1 Tax=Allosphingosinicella sp. TaxID=2823234 RepID=UPI002F2ADA69
MKALMTGAALGLALTLGGCGSGSEGGSTSSSGPVAPVPAPAGKSWTDVVSATPQGGFVMGNPDAAVKVVEFASLTCGACANFAEQGFPNLVDKYVKTGQVSFELRNFVRDPADLAAALLSRCSGPGPYFQLSEQLFAAQPDWLGKLQSMSPAAQQQLQAAQPSQAVSIYADQAGLLQFVRVRGVPAEKAQACLADQGALQSLVDGTSSAARDYDITGTPTFLINNRVVPNAANWATLEPQIKAAVGG